MVARLIAILSLLAVATAFRSSSRWVRSMNLHDVPLELTGKLDASRKWDVTLIMDDVEKVVSISEGQSVLECAEKTFRGVESSCRNGVCTTCAGQVVAEPQNMVQAVNCLGKPQLDAGFVCTCQTYVCGPGVKVLLGQYDSVYETQYGQFEKSYVKGTDNGPESYVKPQ